MAPFHAPLTSFSAQTRVMWSSPTLGALPALLQEPEAMSGPQLGGRVNLGAWSGHPSSQTRERGRFLES